MFGFLAFMLTFAGAACFYLGCRHQRWRRNTLPFVVAAPVSAVLLLLGLAAWIQATRPDTGIFIFLTLLMLLWSCFPFLAVCLARESGDA